jgi:hypothetical protein
MRNLKKTQAKNLDKQIFGTGKKIGSKKKAKPYPVKEETLGLPSGLTQVDKLQITVDNLEYKLAALEKFVADMYAKSSRIIKEDDTSKEEKGIRYGN